MDLIAAMRAFVAVADAGSFTAGADRLGISNKVVGKQVAALEKHLALRLLHRTTRTSSLTEAGLRYHEGCLDVLARLDALEAGVRGDESTLRGTLRVSAPVTYGEMVVAPILPAFAAAHPALVVDLSMSDRHVDLASEGFDLAIRIGRLADSSLIARRLAATEVWTVASPDYLDDASRPRRPDDLKAHVCVRDTNFRGGGSWAYRVDGQRRTVAVGGGVRVNSARSVRDLVLAGSGVGRCPSYVVEADVRAGRLIRLLKRFEAQTLDVHAVYSTARNVPPRVRAFLAFLQTGLT